MDNYKEIRKVGRAKTTSGQKQSITKQAKKSFEIWNKNRNDKTEEFRQCKSVKYWFVSDKGTVISFYKRKEPLYLSIQETEQGYKFVSSSKKPYTYYVHRLQAEAFDVYAYGKAKKRKTLDGLEVHHMEGNKINDPNSEEILEPETHEKLFKNVPGINDDDSKQIEYMQRISKIVQENTPNQSVVVFSGTGIKEGKEVKDLTQVIYADDFPGITKIVEDALNKLKTESYILCVPETEKDRELYKKLLETPGESEKLNQLIRNLYREMNKKNFSLTYQGISLTVTIS